jgi:DNA polymerase-3 subunit delta'
MWDIIGHDHVVDLLQKAIAADRLPHALLFVGPAGVGKTTLALELAKALNCVGDHPPCGRCVHCHQIAGGLHPDVSVIERADGKDSITIQQVRVLRDAASLRPYQGSKKVYIVAGAEAITAQAADALLKTLEEPQPQVMIILTAAEADALPTTVISRSRVLSLQPVPNELIAARLAEHIPAEEARRIAGLARGNVGWALQAAKQPKLASQQEEALSRLAGILDMNLEARLQLAESLCTERKDRSQLRRSVELMLLLARDVLLLGQGIEPQTAVGVDADSLRRQSRRYTLSQLHDYIQGIRVAMERIDQNVEPRLTLEALLVSLP